MSDPNYLVARLVGTDENDDERIVTFAPFDGGEVARLRIDQGSVVDVDLSDLQRAVAALIAWKP